MRCAKCGFLSFDTLDRCKRCGAEWTKNRVQGTSHSVIKTSEEPAGWEFQAESEPVTTAEAPEEAAVLKLRLDEEFDRLYEDLRAREGRGDFWGWGGFWRRSVAFFVDLIVLFMLTSLLFYLVNVGYRVGLSANGQTLTVAHLLSLIRIFMLAWLALVAGYFVMLPAMSGTTVGKWLFGLKIVTVNHAPISYPQATLRWLGYAVSFPFGLGFVWILVSREKRAWHDFLARTWVVRV